MWGGVGLAWQLQVGALSSRVGGVCVCCMPNGSTECQYVDLTARELNSIPVESQATFESCAKYKYASNLFALFQLPPRLSLPREVCQSLRSVQQGTLSLSLSYTNCLQLDFIRLPNLCSPQTQATQWQLLSEICS